MSDLESRGIPSVGIATTEFQQAAEAQAKALKGLSRLCRKFCEDGEARTPTDWDKELGGKLEAY